MKRLLGLLLVMGMVGCGGGDEPTSILIENAKSTTPPEQYLFKYRFPDAQIMAIESDPLVFDCLKVNMKSFNFKDVRLFDRALWVTKDELSFQSDNRWGRFVGLSDEAPDSNSASRLGDST